MLPTASQPQQSEASSSVSWSCALLPGDAPARLRAYVETWLQAEHVFRCASRALDAALAAHGLSRASFPLLAILSMSPTGCSVSQLVRLSGQTPSSMSGLLQRMERAGLCVRLRAPHDGRGAIISLSQEGEAVLRNATMDYAKWAENAMVHCPPAQLDEFRHATRMLTPAFSNFGNSSSRRRLAGG